MTARVVRG